MKPARLFAFEGPDGVGKTTLAASVAEMLNARDVDTMYVSFPGKEQADSLGSLVYTLQHGPTTTDPTAMQVAHVAAHIDGIRRRIRPALAGGRVVILDRYWWSTLAYAQVSGCSMPIVEAAIHVEQLAWGDIRPARIFLVDRTDPYRREHGRETFAALRSAYRHIAMQEGDAARFFSNDASVPESVRQLVTEILGELGAGGTT